jgi:hypothetical protein
MPPVLPIDDIAYVGLMKPVVVCYELLQLPFGDSGSDTLHIYGPELAVLP